MWLLSVCEITDMMMYPKCTTVDKFGIIKIPVDISINKIEINKKFRQTLQLAYLLFWMLIPFVHQISLPRRKAVLQVHATEKLPSTSARHNNTTSTPMKI